MNFKIVFAEDDILDHFLIYIKPSGGHYKGQEHILSFKTKYGSGSKARYFPYNAPKVTFLTQIYHPNISRSGGSICVDILTDEDKWLPSYDFSAVMTSIILLMEVPNNASPYNSAAANLFRKCEKIYKSNVSSGMSATDRQKVFNTSFNDYVNTAKTYSNVNNKIVEMYKTMFQQQYDEKKE